MNITMSLFKLIVCGMIRMNTLSLYKFVRLAFCSINATFFLYKFLSHMNDQGVVTHLSRQMRKKSLMKRLMRKINQRLQIMLITMQIMLIMMQIMFIMLVFVPHYWIPEWFSKWMNGDFNISSFCDVED